MKFILLLIVFFIPLQAEDWTVEEESARQDKIKNIRSQILSDFVANGDEKKYDQTDPRSILQTLKNSQIFSPSGDPDKQKAKETLDKFLNDFKAKESYEKVITPDLNSDKDPMHNNGNYKLWMFWSIDSEYMEGMPDKINEVDKSKEFEVISVHLISLKQGERYISEYHNKKLAYQKEIEKIQATKASPKQQEMDAREAFNRILDKKTMDADRMLKMFYPRGLSIKPNTTAAKMLQVSTVPCFRLVSPHGRIHVLDGWTPNYPLLEFCRKAKEWDLENPEVK